MRRDDSQKVFRGHLKECMQHFTRNFIERYPRGSKGAAEAKSPIADFCGVSVGSVTRWLYRDERLPLGEALIKLMFFLDMIGYEVIEIERLPDERRNFAALIGFGLLSSEEATSLLGYAQTSILLNVLHGNQRASKDRDRLMWDTWKTKRAELEEKRAVLQRQYRLDLLAKERYGMKGQTTSSRLLLIHLKVLISFLDDLLTLLEDESPDGIAESDQAILEPSASTISSLSARLDTLVSQLKVPKQPRGNS